MVGALDHDDVGAGLHGGVLVDSVADSVVRAPRDRSEEGFGEMRLTVYQSGGDVVDFLEYQRSRLRVARSTVLNAAMAGLFGSIAASGTPWCPVVPLTSLAVCVIARLAFVRIDGSYNTRLKQAHELVKHGIPTEKAG